MALSIMFTMPSFSQDSLKITQGKFTTELNVNPFIGELSLNNAINQIKLRYFNNDLSALRIAFTFNTNNQNVEELNPYGQNSYNYKDHRTSTTVGLNFGYEKHFTGTKRLSPYIGIDLALSNKSSSQTSSINNNETKVKGAWMSNTQNGFSYDERAYFSYGLNLVSGFDFYIAQNFYFGYELGFGFNKISFKDIEVTNLYATGSPSPNGNQPERNDKMFQLGPNLLNGIRLGFVF